MSEQVTDEAAEIMEKVGNLFRNIRTKNLDATEETYEQWKARMDAQEKAAAVNNLRMKSNLPLRQFSNSGLDREGEWAKCEQGLVKRLGSGFFVALIGIRGPGKTQIGAELIRRVTENRKTAYYETATAFFLAIKATFKSDNKDTEEAIIDRFAEYHLLVIDEVGQRAESDWENRMFFEMLDRRYRNMKDTLLISNQPYEKFAESIGDSLISRMNETGGIIECNWKSYRNV